MACRDCAWWDHKSAAWRFGQVTSKRLREKGFDRIWSRCLFDEEAKVMPVWVRRDDDQGELDGMLGREGTACPAFKPMEGG